MKTLDWTVHSDSIPIIREMPLGHKIYLQYICRWRKSWTSTNQAFTQELKKARKNELELLKQ